ncbi:MAG: TetR/AcrR family transcriptional regulator [Lachnospiraceae bacterium]|nr:TetR/AcrR family transcriptional regulator [Lachnospiraceae bacterium]
MLKKLTQEQLDQILEIATEEFSAKGPEKATIMGIARKSGVSVGVIYKYYADKEALFQACLTRSLGMLKDCLNQATSRHESLEAVAEELIRIAQSFAKEHPAHIRMYHAITMDAEGGRVEEYARAIESVTAQLYTECFSKAKEEGSIRKDAEPAAFAFFFDNLLMMLHFSYSCEYYRERLRIFCGDSEDRDEKLVQQMLLFLKAGFMLRDTQ